MEFELQLNQLTEGLNIGRFWKMLDENPSSLRSASNDVQTLTASPRRGSCSALLGFTKLPCQQDSSFTPAQLSEQLRGIYASVEIHTTDSVKLVE